MSLSAPSPPAATQATSPSTSTPQPTATATNTQPSQAPTVRFSTGQPEPVQEPTLPPPQLFDILPALHELLSRLLASASLDRPASTAPNTQGADTQATIEDTPSQSQSQSQSAAQSAAQTQTQTQTQTQQDTPSQPQPSSTQTQTQPSQTQTQIQIHPPSTQLPTYPDQAPLPVKDIAAEVSSIRNMIRRAREAVAGLPDVERGISEQERELAYLTLQVERLRGVLGGLKEGDAAAEEKMQLG